MRRQHCHQGGRWIHLPEREIGFGGASGEGRAPHPPPTLIAAHCLSPPVLAASPGFPLSISASVSEFLCPSVPVSSWNTDPHVDPTSHPCVTFMSVWPGGHVCRHVSVRICMWTGIWVRGDTCGCVCQSLCACLSPEACVRTHEWSDSCGYRYARTQDWVCTRACVTSAHRQAVGL